MSARPSARARRMRPDIRKLDVICASLTTAGDRWLWALLWRDVAEHETYEGIETCECCATRTPHQGF